MQVSSFSLVLFFTLSLTCSLFCSRSVANYRAPDSKNKQILDSKKDIPSQNANNSSSNAYKIKTIVIDAGHGGHDSGAKGGISLEKDNALGIALQVGEMISTEYPELKIIYTRTTDIFVPLMDRAAIANRSKADLFMSIHCNSTRLTKKIVNQKVKNKILKKTTWVGDPRIYGTETYVLGLHRTKDNLEVASRENQVILLEKDNGKKYEKFDITSPAGAIMYSLIASKNLEKSITFASKIEQEFRKQCRLSRGVQQAGFLVLVQTSMPAVLIEAGFMTNPTEEKLLVTKEGRKQIATAIFTAFKEYKKEVEQLNI